jgi:hypothetical protein
MPTAINFHHLVSGFNSADFSHCIGQGFDVINAGLQCFWVWSKPHHITTARGCHASRVIFTQVITMRFGKSCQWSKHCR